MKSSLDKSKKEILEGKRLRVKTARDEKNLELGAKEIKIKELNNVSNVKDCLLNRKSSLNSIKRKFVDEADDENEGTVAETDEEMHECDVSAKAAEDWIANKRRRNERKASIKVGGRELSESEHETTWFEARK
ncbi:hypothetical protein MBLNU13_g02804t1 [Cladosporium sp. NU13]